MKTTANKTATAPQIKALHAMFRQAGMDDEERHEFIRNFTNGRTDSTKELTMEEARKILDALTPSKEEREAKRTKLREEAKRECKAIYMLSLQISFLNKDFPTDNEADFEMNKAKINQFCKNRTKFRKPITQMNLEELRAVHRQLESIARKENNLL